MRWTEDLVSFDIGGYFALRIICNALHFLVATIKTDTPLHYHLHSKQQHITLRHFIVGNSSNQQRIRGFKVMREEFSNIPKFF
jgi:hypothetical protein